MESDELLIEELEETEDLETQDLETQDQETQDQEIEDQENEVLDYTSILQEMNERLENIEAKTIDYSEPINGLLANTYFVDFVAFTVFVFLLVCLVIKFFKIFF